MPYLRPEERLPEKGFIVFSDESQINNILGEAGLLNPDGKTVQLTGRQNKWELFTRENELTSDVHIVILTRPNGDVPLYAIEITKENHQALIDSLREYSQFDAFMSAMPIKDKS